MGLRNGQTKRNTPPTDQFCPPPPLFFFLVLYSEEKFLLKISCLCLYPNNFCNNCDSLNDLELLIQILQTSFPFHYLKIWTHASFSYPMFYLLHLKNKQRNKSISERPEGRVQWIQQWHSPPTGQVWAWTRVCGKPAHQLSCALVQNNPQP